MIPALIIWLISRYRQRKKLSRNTVGFFKVSAKRLLSKGHILLLSVLLLFAAKANSQEKMLKYGIIRNGNKVGTLLFSESQSGGMDYLKMVSDVKTKFIFTFTASAREEAVYFNGVLLRSSIYRQFNGNEKANKQHLAGERQYIIHSGKSSEISKNYPITYNMLSLYSREPEHVSQVYSDNFQTFLAIQKINDHKYKVELPDGNYNCYCYKNGILNLVEIHHSFYSASIVLNEN